MIVSDFRSSSKLVEDTELTKSLKKTHITHGFHEHEEYLRDVYLIGLGIQLRFQEEKLMAAAQHHPHRVRAT